jgi:hypothetical protein
MINDVVANNTFVEAYNTTNVQIEGATGGLSHSNNIFANNLILQTTGTIGSISSISTFNLNHNLWSKLPDTSLKSATDIIGNPLLVDASHTRSAGIVQADWYKLTSGSPAINSAITMSQVTDDYFGTNRGQLPDIGAHEFSSTISSPTLSPTSTISIHGDGNDDGEVNGLDYFLWLNHYNQTIFDLINGDFDKNNKVDGIDYTIWLNNYGK